MPEFVSVRMDKDWHTADRRHRSCRSSPSRMDSRSGSHNSHEIVGEREKRDSDSRRTAHLEDRESCCSPQNKKNSIGDTERNPRSERHRSALSDYRRDERLRGNRRSRSRSPGYQKVFRRSDNYRPREKRSDSLVRRHSDNFSSQSNVSDEKSPHRDRSGLSTYARSMQPSRRDCYVVTDTRRSGDRPESRRFQEMAHSNDDKAHCSKYVSTDIQNSSEVKDSGTRTSYRHSAIDSLSARRGYTNSNRGSRAESYEDIRHCRHLSSGCSDCKDNYQGLSAVSDCRFYDHRQRRGTGYADRDCHYNDRNSHRNGASPLQSSRNEFNNTPYRDRNDEDDKKLVIDRRSSPRDRFGSTEDTTASVKEHRTNSYDRQSSSTGHGYRSESRSTDRANSSSSLKESSSYKRSKQFQHEPEHSSVGMEKSFAVSEPSAPDSHVSSHCKDASSTCQSSQVSYFSETGQSVMIPATSTCRNPSITDPLANSCLQTSRKTDVVMYGSEYRAATTWPEARGRISSGSDAQPMIHSGQHLVGPAAGSHLVRPRWPGSVPYAATTSTRLHDLVPTAAVTQLPLLSTGTSAVRANTDPGKLLVPGVSLSSNVTQCAAYNPPSAGAGSIIQYTIDDVYGDSPLLDEPMYSPIAAHNSSFSLVGSSSISSMDYNYLPRPELMRPVDSLELQKMLDVVTVAKTSLEQTLPPAGQQPDPSSLKKQKVMFEHGIGTLVLCDCHIFRLLPHFFAYFSIFKQLCTIFPQISAACLVYMRSTYFLKCRIKLTCLMITVLAISY